MSSVFPSTGDRLDRPPAAGYRFHWSDRRSFVDFATPIIAVHYAEIALKGKNRPSFQRRLINNMRVALADEQVRAIDHVESRLLVHLDDPGRAEAAAQKLRRVFGIQWLSPAVPVPRAEVDEQLTRVCEIACALAEQDRGDARNFKVETRRSDRSFPLVSPEISAIVGGAVHERTGLPGRMSNPDFKVNVLVLKDTILVFTRRTTAFGGLPAGTGGRVAVLLSGGIDSPVAAWMMMRRGCRPDFVHFHTGRSPAEADLDKIHRLVEILAGYSPRGLTLHQIPVVPYEERAIGVIRDSYDMVMFRRFMFRTAERIARANSCLALVAGDSLGQVASQTLYNLAAIGPDLRLPVFRPLIGMDKTEITRLSRTIGAFETSILPYRDCCSIRSPRPVLNARSGDLLRLSTELDLEAAIDEARAGATQQVIEAR